MELPEEVMEDAKTRGKFRWADVDGLSFQCDNGVFRLYENEKYTFSIEDLPAIEAVFDLEPGTERVEAGTAVFLKEHPDPNRIHFYAKDEEEGPWYFMSRAGFKTLQALVAQPYDLEGL